MANGKIKTFKFNDDGEEFECCVAIDNENNIFMYSVDEDGCWEDFADVTMNPGPGAFVPPGYVVINHNLGKDARDALIVLGIIDQPESVFSIRCANVIADVCKFNPEKAKEWNAYDALFA